MFFFSSACVVIFIIIYFLKVQMESFTGHQDHVQLGDILNMTSKRNSILTYLPIHFAIFSVYRLACLFCLKLRCYP